MPFSIASGLLSTTKEIHASYSSALMHAKTIDERLSEMRKAIRALDMGVVGAEVVMSHPRAIRLQEIWILSI